MISEVRSEKLVVLTTLRLRCGFRSLLLILFCLDFEHWVDASVIAPVAVTCPVCAAHFDALAVVSADSRGGVDRDLFSRSDGPQQVYARISTCPTCSYAGYLTDFAVDVTLSDGFIEKVRVAPKLDAAMVIDPGADQRDIDPDRRFALAVQCYQWRGRSAEALGWLYLRWSWLVREDTSMVPPDRRLARVLAYAKRWVEPADAQSNQSDRELRLVGHLAAALGEGRFNRYQIPFVKLAMALLLRRHGEHAHAEPLLTELCTDPHLTDPLRQAAERMARSIDRERELQAHAAAHLAHALQNDEIQPPNDAVARYLVGELHRRIDQDAEAIPWYDTALANPALPADLRVWAVRQRRIATSAAEP